MEPNVQNVIDLYERQRARLQGWLDEPDAWPFAKIRFDAELMALETDWIEKQLASMRDVESEPDR